MLYYRCVTQNIGTHTWIHYFKTLELSTFGASSERKKMDEKILTVVVPCYNSQDYMKHCIKTLLNEREGLEIIIVDDGSTDDTAQIADALEKKYPDIIRAIHQENGGHGEALNTGIKNAQGTYIKIVDSDDWVSKTAFHEIMTKLRFFTSEESKVLPDLVISNFVYEKVGKKIKKVMRYHHLPKDELFTWNRFSLKGASSFLLMHSLIYRTGLLRECRLTLPKHTFYVDNLYAYIPLPYVKTMYYIDVNFYRYYVGRPDQSVHEDVMLTRLDQQLRVNKIMIDAYRLFDDPRTENPSLRAYMLKDVNMITTISSILLIRTHTKTGLEKRDELWDYLKQKDIKMWRKMKKTFLGRGVTVNGKFKRKIAELIYLEAKSLIGFS